MKFTTNLVIAIIFQPKPHPRKCGGTNPKNEWHNLGNKLWDNYLVNGVPRASCWLHYRWGNAIS